MTYRKSLFIACAACITIVALLVVSLRVSVTQRIATVCTQLGITSKWESSEHAVAFFRRAIPAQFPRGTSKETVTHALLASGFEVRESSDTSEVFYVSLSPAAIIDGNELFVRISYDANDTVAEIIVDN